MAFDNLLVDRDGAIAVLTINRPKVLNALNSQTLDELRRAILELKQDVTVRVLIVTGAGDKAFVAGADINELGVQTPTSGREHALTGQHVFELLETIGKPVIAAINGFALGGGCELAMACTLRFAAENAKLGQPEILLGLIPGYAGTQRLPRLVGVGKALELLLTGSQISATEAMRIGLVNRVVPRRGTDARGSEAGGTTGRQRADRHGVHHRRRQSWRRDAVCRGVSIRGNPVRPRRLHRGHARRHRRVPCEASGDFHRQVAMRTIEGSKRATGFRFAIVVAKYNDFITDRLQAGALAALAASGVASDDVTLVRVPGAFEIPLAAQHAAESGRYDAIVCLGCLIRGETSHFEFISSAVSQGLTAAAAATGVPMAFGVLTTHSVEEALARAGDGAGNKGYEAAVAAVEMAEVVAQLTRQATPRR